MRRAYVCKGWLRSAWWTVEGGRRRREGRDGSAAHTHIDQGGRGTPPPKKEKEDKMTSWPVLVACFVRVGCGKKKRCRSGWGGRGNHLS